MLIKISHWRILLVILVFASASACETSVVRTLIPDLSFSHLPTFKFAVNEIIIRDYRLDTKQKSNIEASFPIPVSDALKQWAEDRLIAAGGTNTMLLIIEEARASSELLEIDKDLEALFTLEQAERITAVLKVQIQIIDKEEKVLAFTRAECTRSRTIGENISLNERDIIYNEITTVLMNDFNTSQEQEIHKYFKSFTN